MIDDSVFQHAVDLWSIANLPELQKQLDDSVLTVKELESKSLISRKALASETKQFKKLDGDEKLGQVNKMIKSYQQEVDSLTSRSKFSEEVIYNLYSKLSETPDPQPLLEAFVQQSERIDDVQNLNSTIEELQNKISKYADYDKIRARLLDLEQNSAKTLTKRLSAKEQELNSQFQEKERNWKEREKELARQLESYKDTNKILETKLTQTVDGNGDVAEISERQSAEHQLLSQEIQSSQARVIDLERRNEELSGALAKATSEEERESEMNAKNLKINELESENALLSASLERERNSIKAEMRAKQGSIKALEQQLATSQDELDKKIRKLNVYADYDTIKQELSALKKIEFGASDDESGNVDSALLSANKKLQSKLAELRGKFSGMEKEATQLSKEVKRLTDQVKHLESLNTKLELDLEKVDNVSVINDTVSMMSGVTRQMNRVGTSTRPGGKLSPTSSIVGIPEENELQTVSNGNSTILPIVTQQRDRLRAKTTELEKKLRQTNLNQGHLRTELEKFKADNTKLYERVRYLSSYGSKRDNMEDDNAYSRTYNESLHPLAEFRQQELDRFKKTGISPLEKLFSSFAKIVLANKTSRMLFMFYCLGLHGLVLMICIYVANLSGYGEMRVENGVKI
ncbi:LANO_0G03906g1_1 [Lachancea nothofagi CBS 11611]|uniref:Protein CASP n=1 Tax=Lachancea nothofagi CBS 11611 TaxID=1266666 RepID=A0A1G4KGB1_9SACH|nr:LANO_0G03906g1_1 [Lachancea nothofagi CBS 11611]